ncbi:MAG: ABC transporter ATP-binding protein [Actinomycetota bacterium]
MRVSRARKVGFVFQQFNLIPNLSALENVMLPLEFARWSVSDREIRAREVLNTVGLGDDKVLRRPARLSGGEQQRVAIARALVTDPELILADEPTGNLDRKTGERIIALLREAAGQEKRTVVVVTHDEKIAKAADRRLEIEDGVLREIA